MSFVAVAIGGAAVVGAGASIYEGGKAAKAQKKAANQATDLEQKQLDEQTREYNQSRDDLAPWRSAGTVALGQLANYTSGDPNQVAAAVTADPGYKFGLDQGTRAVEASAAARGGVLSGGTLKALTRYGTDYAGTKLNDSFNRLATIAGLGQNAESQQLGSTANYLGLQQQGTNNITGNILAAGNARSSQYVNTANAIGGAANQVGQYFALKDLVGTKPKAANASSYGGYTGTGDYGYGASGAYGVSGSDGIY